LFLKTKQIANTTLTVALTSKGQFQINSLEWYSIIPAIKNMQIQYQNITDETWSVTLISL
jgi:hypothetical protein